ncbi:uncharacterized protein LOC113557420 [Rhopalosiphum maidis]|uniref:uncharacterized protein LOC113557420 n=1 Tax=Rhopalosiphum maidis TaxID=43146 RepID=UPI000F00E5C1|nr:uncharacterized protein LOC113557420 [Rhopalosiphum maidis]
MKSNIHIPSALRLISITIFVVAITSTAATFVEQCKAILNCAGFTGSYHIDIIKKSAIDDIIKIIKPFRNDMPKGKEHSSEEMLKLLKKRLGDTQEPKTDEEKHINTAKEILNKCSSTLTEDNWVDIFQISLHYLITIEQLSLLNIFQGTINQIAYELLNNVDSVDDINKINDMLKRYWTNSQVPLGEYTDSSNYNNAYCRSIDLTGGKEKPADAFFYFNALLPKLLE